MTTALSNLAGWFLGCLGLVTGHVALAVWVLNVCYGLPWPKPRLRRLRKLHLAWVLIGTPLLVVWFTLSWFGHDVPPGVGRALWLYTIGCWAVALVGFLPAQTARLLRRRPEWQRSNHTRVVDLERKLGVRPVARGPKWWFALLKGNQQFQVEFVQKEFALPALPAELDGVTILHVTDLHFSGVLTPRFYEAIFAELSHWPEPDIVALTGDYIDNEACYDWIPELLGQLRGRFAQFAVVGNHDNWFDVAGIKRRLQAAGFELARPEGRILELHGRRLLVAGTEWPWIGSLPAPVDAHRADFALLLSHGPDVAYEAARRGYHLTLCGHNHGGQVRLPVLGPVYMPSRYGRRFDMGLFRVGDMALFVNKGLGGEHPLRIGARPEVALITLRAASLECQPRQGVPRRWRQQHETTSLPQRKAKTCQASACRA